MNFATATVATLMMTTFCERHEHGIPLPYSRDVGAETQIDFQTEVRIMKFHIRSRSQAATPLILSAGLFFASLILPSRASASLSGDVASVDADQQQMKAARAVHAYAKYSVHEITTPYGTVVREYVSPAGQVFGVAWRGPFLPNLQQLLGSNYAKFAQAAQDVRDAHPRRSRNLPVTVEQPDLFVHSAGHMRAFIGHAYVPGMIPQGVEAQEIR